MIMFQFEPAISLGKGMNERQISVVELSLCFSLGSAPEDWCCGLNYVPSKFMFAILTSNTSECDYLWR
jgi:hypothetical protein